MRSDAVDFSQRAHLSELMDEPCSYEVFRDCLIDLEKVNRLLGGYGPTLGWIGNILKQHKGEEVHILDAGSGGGGMLREVEKLAKQHVYSVHLTGIDMNEHAAQASRELTRGQSQIHWVTGDVFSYRSFSPIHLVTSSLFTHHLSEDEIVRFLMWMEATAVSGWFINDLRRSAKSYYSFKALAWAMRWHRFVRHDGPISIRRAFIAEDWIRMCAAAGLSKNEVRIEEKPFGRLCVSRIKR